MGVGETKPVPKVMRGAGSQVAQGPNQTRGDQKTMQVTSLPWQSTSAGLEMVSKDSRRIHSQRIQSVVGHKRGMFWITIMSNQSGSMLFSTPSTEKLT